MTSKKSDLKEKKIIDCTQEVLDLIEKVNTSKDLTHLFTQEEEDMIKKHFKL